MLHPGRFWVLGAYLAWEKRPDTLHGPHRSGEEKRSLAWRHLSPPNLLAGNAGHVKRNPFDIVKRDNAWHRAGPCGGIRPFGWG